MNKQNKTKDFKRNDKSRSRNSRRGSNDYDPKAKDRENSTKEAYGNDISWYVNNPQMLIDACQVSFAETLRGPMSIKPGAGGANTTNILEEPGVMQISIAPTIGEFLYAGTYSAGDVWDSAVNMSARAEWSHIRQKNAGAKNYDAADLMMYHLAMDSIYMYWSWMVRLYGYLKTFAFKNKYYPYTILQAMGIDRSDAEYLIGHMASFRTYINWFAAEMSSMAVPNNLPYVSRHLWLFQNIFVDSTTSKCQTYLYNPAFIWRASRNSTTQATQLTEQAMPWQVSGNNILEKMQTVGKALLHPVISDEGFNIMSGDILKAYEASGIYGFTSIPEDFKLQPQYDQIVLSQIHNLTLFERASSTAMVKQDPSVDAGFIWMEMKGNSPKQRDNAVLDLKTETPTPTDVMYATRLTALPDPDHSNWMTCGSEVAVELKIYDIATVEGTPTSFDADDLILTAWEDSTHQPVCEMSEVITTLARIDLLTKFDWHPLLIFGVEYTDTTPHVNMYRFIGDIDNFTILPNSVLANIHKVALNSMFNMPYTLVK